MLGPGVLLDLQVTSTGWSILNCLPVAARLLSEIRVIANAVK